MIQVHVGVFRPAAFAAGGLAALVLSAGIAAAQTYGFATMQPGTLNHTSASAVAKVLKDKAGLNVVVQPTAGESVMIPLVARGEAEFGIANIFEVEGAKAANPDLRLIGSLHSLRGAFWVRKDTTMKTIADLKGKKVGMGYSAMRTLDPMIKAILATGGVPPSSCSDHSPAAKILPRFRPSISRACPSAITTHSAVRATVR